MQESRPMFEKCGAELKEAAIFSACGESEIRAILDFSKLHSYDRDEVLFRQNEPVAYVYLLLSGSVALIRRDQTGRERIVEFLESGETFGEASLLCGEGCMGTALAVSDCRLLAINALRFIRCIQENPTLAWRVLARVSHRLHGMMQQVERLSLYNARQKLAAYLMDRIDDEHPGSVLNGIPKRRKDLASILSVTPETLSRELSWLRNHGLVDMTHGGGIMVRDRQSLSAVLA